jgi:hypothetical protein
MIRLYFGLALRYIRRKQRAIDGLLLVLSCNAKAQAGIDGDVTEVAPSVQHAPVQEASDAPRTFLQR